MDKQDQEGICVAIRMRGLNERELKSGSAPVFKCLTNERVALINEKDGNPIERDTYQYDKVFDSKANTVNIYDHVGRNLVEGVVTGINATIFAYGQTSSGKTYTMLGAQGSQGVLELAATDLFRHIADTSNRDFIVRVSFVEIYNEVIRDLLSDASDSTVNIREDPRKGVYCEASEHAIQDFDSVMTVLKKGISRRAVESTAMNDTSSRSHTIFKITVESIESLQEGVDRDMSVLVASLNLVDLAGSESVRHTGATGQRAKEGGKINQSLLSLSRVIHALSQPGTHVSFRDSKLTRLLQPSLCGNAKMSIVCCVTPAEKYIEETRSTLQFASRAKMVKTNATVNEILDESEKIRRLTKELNALKEKQSEGGLSDGERNMLQADKEHLQDRLESLQNEKDQQRAQLQKLQELMFENTLPSMDALEGKMKKKRKTKRDTWCPGADLGPEESFLKPLEPLKSTSSVALLPISESVGTGRSSLDSHGSFAENSDHTDELASMTVLVKSLQDELESNKQLIYTLQSKEESLPTGISDEMDALTAANVELQNSLDEALVQIEELTYQRDDFEERLDLEMGANQETEQEFDKIKTELTAEISLLKDLVEAKDNENVKLKTELDEANVTLHGQLEFSLMEEAADMKSRVETLTEEKKEMESIIEAKSAKIVELISFLSAAKDSVGALEAELVDVREESDCQKRALEASLTDSEHSLTATNEELGAWMAACEKQIAHSAALEERFAALQAENSSISDAYSTVQEQVDKLSNREDEYSKQIQELNEQIAGMQGIAGDTSAQSELEEAMKAQQDAHADELDSVFKELETAEEELEKMSKENVASSETISALQSEITALKAQIDEQTEEKSEVQTVLYEQTNELKALQAQVSDMTEKLSAFDAMEMRCQTMETGFQELEASKAEMQAQLDSSLYEFDNVQKMLQSTEEELLSVSSDIIARENEVDSLTAELDVQKGLMTTAAEKASAQIDELQEEINRLNQVLAETQALDSTAQLEMEELKAQLLTESESIASLKLEFQRVQSSNEEEVTSLQAQLEEKSQHLAETLQLMEELSPSANVSDEEHMLLKEELFSCQSRLEEVTLNNESLTEQVNDLNEELSSQTQTLEEAVSDLSTSSSKIMELTECKTSSMELINELKLEIEALQNAVEEGQLKDKLDEVEGDLSGADELICELQLKIINLEKDVSDSELKISVLEQSHEAQLDEVTSQLTNLTDQINKAQIEIDQLNLQKASLEEEVAALKIEMEAKLESDNELNLQKASLEEEVAALKVEMEAKLESDNELNLQKASLEEEVAALKIEMEAKLESDNLEAKNLQKKVEEIEEELLGLSSDMLQKDTIIESLNADIDNLRASATTEAMQGTDAHAVELSNVQQSAQHAISALEQQVGDLEAQLSVMSQAALGSADDFDNHQKDFSTEIQKLNSIVGQKDGEISKLMAEVTSLKERSATAEASLSMSIQHGSVADMDGDAQAKRSRQLQTQMDLLLSEKDTLVFKLSEVEKERKRIEHAAADAEFKLVAEVDTLKNQVQKLSESSHSANAQMQSLAAVEKSLEIANVDLKSMRELHEAAMATIASLETANATLEEKMSSFSDSAQLQVLIDQLQAEKDELQKKYQETLAEQNDLELRCKRTKSDFVMMSDEVSRLGDAEIALQNERETLLQTIETLQQEVTQTTSAAQGEGHAEVLSNYEEEIAVLKESVEMLEVENAQLNQTASEISSELEEKAAEVEDLAARCEQEAASNLELTNQISDISKEKSLLEGRVDTLEQEMASLLAGASEKRAQQLALIEKLESVIVQKDKEIALMASSSTTSDDNEDHLQLIAEMNTLMEQKMEAEAKIQSAELETKKLRLELSDYDKKSAKEVSMMMEAAQSEMDFLKSSFDKERADGYNEIKSLREQISRLEETNSNTAVISAATAELEAELDEAIASSNMLQLQHDEAMQSLHTLKNEHKQLQHKYSSYKTEMVELIEVKDQRIAKLEKSKLTTDQMQKIKQVRENCTKKTEECKIYKKQLAQLKTAYDTLQETVAAESDSAKRSTRSSSKASTAELADLKLNLAEVTSQLEQANFVSKTLKDKLKDCSKQLQEYEHDRHTIIGILEECDIDVAGLMLNDESNVDESVLDEQELSDPVNQLAQKWKSASSLTVALKSQLSDAEDRFMTLSSDVESSRTQKMALEKKLESAKNALKASKLEQDELIAQIENAKESLREVKGELAVAKSSISGNEDAISTEIQVLEEENIELLRENKDLRISSATYRAKAEALARKLGTSVDAADQGSGSDETATPALTKKRSAAVTETANTPCQSDVKKPKESHENDVSFASVEKRTHTHTPSTRTFGTTLDENTMHATSTTTATSSVVKPASAVGASRRGRRVKAKAVETTTTTGESSEQPGECAQS